MFKAGGLVGLALAGVCACGPASGRRPVDVAVGREGPVLGAGVPVAPGATVWVRSDVPGSQVVTTDPAGNILAAANADFQHPSTIYKLDPTGQSVLYITERCVIELTETGLTVIEIAPGIDLEKDVLRKADVPLLVSPDLGLMSAALFRPEPMGLILARRPSRIAHQSTAHR